MKTSGNLSCSRDLRQSYSERHLATKHSWSAQAKQRAGPECEAAQAILIEKVLLLEMVSAEVNCLSDITDFSWRARPFLPGDGQGGALPHTSRSAASGLHVLSPGDPLTALSPQESPPEIWWTLSVAATCPVPRCLCTGISERSGEQ